MADTQEDQEMEETQPEDELEEETQPEETTEEATEETTEEVDEEALEEVGDELVFLRNDSDNLSFYLAFKAYHDDRNYEEAIAKFQAAIEHEEARNKPSEKDIEEEEDFDDEEISEDESEDIVAKSMYWLGESYLKTQQIDKAIEVFKQLADDFSKHYLQLAAQRRADALKANRQ